MATHQFNNIRKIRKLLHLSTMQLAEKCNCSSQHIYTLERGTQELNELWILKLTKAFQCDKYYLFNDFEDIDFLNRRVIDKKQDAVQAKTDKETEKQKNIVGIKYYNNITDLANDENKITQQYEKQQLESLTNILIKDSSAIKICRNKTETLLINTSMTTPSEEPGVFVVKNELEEGATTFIATVHIDVLTGKVMMCLQDGLQQFLLSTCKIIGRVVSKIVSV